MSNGSLTYVRKDNNRPKPFQRTGFEYLHNFGTGQQSLVFDDHEAAKKFAEREGAAYTGPQLRARGRPRKVA